MRLIALLLGGIILFGCTPTVKKVAFHRSKEGVVVVKRGSLSLSSEERSFISKEAEKFGIDIPERKEIEKFLRLYLRDRRSLRIALKRANLYAPYIKPILKEYGLPEELALLPLVESGFNPFAVSPSGAAGIWQLMPQTARRFGLRVDKNVDERFDLIKSTHAAARYLKELHERFGSWELVLAAYNCGEGCVQRRTGSGDFWKTKWALPEQTRKYVPMFFATLLIARSPEKYGLKVDVNNLFVDRKVADRRYTVKEFVRKAGLRESTFRDLNPHIRGRFIPAGVYVYVPKATSSNVYAKQVKKRADQHTREVKVSVVKAKTKPANRTKVHKKIKLAKVDKKKTEAVRSEVGKKTTGVKVAKVSKKTKSERKHVEASKGKVKKVQSVEVKRPKVRTAKAGRPAKRISRERTKTPIKNRMVASRGRALQPKPRVRAKVVKAESAAPEFAPKLIIRSDEGEQVKILHRKTKVVKLENGALLYIKE